MSIVPYFYAITDPLMIEVFNMEGKAIFKGKCEDDYKACMDKLQDMRLPSNVYFLRIHTELIHIERCIRIDS
jgi:hypothetical protein